MRRSDIDEKASTKERGLLLESRRSAGATGGEARQEESEKLE